MAAPVIFYNSPRTLNVGIVGSCFQGNTGGTPTSHAVTAGALPTGMVLDAHGRVRGTPTAIESGSFEITATNVDGSSSDTVVFEVLAEPNPNAPFEWTTFTPSVDTNIVYVSSSEGTTRALGADGTIGNPYSLIHEGYEDLRNGYPDWLLLKKGDTFELDWQDGFGSPWGPDGLPQPPHEEWYFEFNKSGRSATEMMLLSSYGTGARPYLHIGAIGGGPVLNLGNTARSYVAFVGFNCAAPERNPADGAYVYEYRRADSPYTSAGRGVLIEDCRFSFMNGFALVGDGTRLIDFSVRGCVVDHVYSEGQTNCQGWFIGDAENLKIEQCVAYRNGWYPTIHPANIYNRNFYISGCFGAVIRDTIDCAGASGGMQIRVGGTVENNLCIGNPSGITFGHAQNEPNYKPYPYKSDGVIRNNVVLDADIPGLNRALGIAIPAAGLGVRVYNNIVAHNEHLNSQNCIGIQINGDEADPGYNNEVYNNIVYDWGLNSSQGTGVNFGGIAVTTTTGGTIHDNVFSPGHGGWIVYAENAGEIANKFSFYNNHYDSDHNTNSWFRVLGDTDYDLAGWSAAYDDTNSDTIIPVYPDPNRTIATYMTSLGLTPTLEAFMEAAMANHKENWDPRFTAQAVNEYVRRGFGMGGTRTVQLGRILIALVD